MTTYGFMAQPTEDYTSNTSAIAGAMAYLLEQPLKIAQVPTGGLGKRVDSILGFGGEELARVTQIYADNAPTQVSVTTNEQLRPNIIRQIEDAGLRRVEIPVH